MTTIYDLLESVQLHNIKIIAQKEGKKTRLRVDKEFGGKLFTKQVLLDPEMLENKNSLMVNKVDLIAGVVTDVIADVLTESKKI